MGTTAEKLQAVLNSKADIGAAITEKGGTVPTKLSEYGNAIRALPKLEPPDAKRIYSGMRPAGWPQMPEDVPDHTIVFFYPEGSVKAAFTVTCEGQYTVEIKAKINGETTVESVETFDSGTAYSKEIQVPETEFERRFITVSAATISDFTLSDIDGSETKMPGCAELLCRLPAMRVPIFRDMKDLKFATLLGESGGTTSSDLFRDCTSLICVIGPDINLKGSKNYAFRGCENLMALDITVDPSTIAQNYIFYGCKALSSIPKQFTVVKMRNMSDAFHGCVALREMLIESDPSNKTTASFSNAFTQCVSLEKIVISGNFNMTAIQSPFDMCSSLRHLIFHLPNWTGFNFSVKGCAFEREGLVEMFESLPTVTTARTITITGNPGVPDLTEEDKAIATAKNWTLVL